MEHETEQRQTESTRRALGASGAAVAPTSAFVEDDAPPRRPAGPLLVRLARAIWRDPRWLFGVALLVIALAALFAPFIAPYSPLLVHPVIARQPPSAAHLFGTDSLGRDQLSRVIYGARISLSVGIISILIGGGFGTLLGIIAGFVGGWADRLIAVLVDALLAFPALILALAIATVLGPSAITLVVALAIVRVPVYARLARSQTLQIRSLDYIVAARMTGSRAGRLMRAHILPNIFSPLLVQATISISFTILDESVLSFLGLGVLPPTAEWGKMISDAQPFLINGADPWMMLGPVLALVLTVLSLNLLGDALRDRLDPRSVVQNIPLRR